MLGTLWIMMYIYSYYVRTPIIHNLFYSILSKNRPISVYIFETWFAILSEASKATDIVFQL